MKGGDKLLAFSCGDDMPARFGENFGTARYRLYIRARIKVIGIFPIPLNSASV